MANGRTVVCRVPTCANYPCCEEKRIDPIDAKETATYHAAEYLYFFMKVFAVLDEALQHQLVRHISCVHAVTFGRCAFSESSIKS